MPKTNKNRVLLINDHPANFGVGKYIFNLYDELLTKQYGKYSFHLLMQNMGENYTVNAPHTTIQYRLFWVKQHGFGKWYNLTSYYYYPRKIPPSYSLFHISSQMMGKSAQYVSPSVVTCHDLISYRVQSNHPRLIQYLRKKHLSVLTKATRIIFISNHTKNDFLSLFDYPEENTATIYLGVSDIFHSRDKSKCRHQLGISVERPVILHVGSEQYRKNIQTLLYTVARIKKDAPEILIIRIGKQGIQSRELVEKLHLGKNILYFRDQSEKALAKFYNAADVLVFPSTYEGFGLPVLEALKSGCPVIASNATSIPEITGDAAILHDPMDVDGFVGSIETVIGSKALQDKYKKKGIERAKRFSWKITAEKTFDIYQQVLEG